MCSLEPSTLKATHRNNPAGGLQDNAALASRVVGLERQASGGQARALERSGSQPRGLERSGSQPRALERSGSQARALALRGGAAVEEVLGSSGGGGGGVGSGRVEARLRDENARLRAELDALNRTASYVGNRVARVLVRLAAVL